MNMDEQEKHEFNLLRTQLNGMRTKLAKRDKQIAELTKIASERKVTIDCLSAENGKLKRRIKAAKPKK